MSKIATETGKFVDHDDDGDDDKVAPADERIRSADKEKSDADIIR